MSDSGRLAIQFWLKQPIGSVTMLLMALGLYAACVIAFYAQMLIHSHLHPAWDEDTSPQPLQAAEVIELFSQTEERKAA